MLYNIVKQIVQEGTAMSQKEKKKLVSIKTDDTLMETALHGTHLFPYKLYDDNITDYDFNCTGIGIPNLNLYISNPV
mgnify:CR=1 FL=1